MSIPVPARNTNVRAGTAGQDRGPQAAHKRIVAVAAVQDIGPGTAYQHVVTSSAVRDQVRRLAHHPAAMLGLFPSAFHGIAPFGCPVAPVPADGVVSEHYAETGIERCRLSASAPRIAHGPRLKVRWTPDMRQVAMRESCCPKN